MSDERILELIEKQDKYYVLGFIKGIKANRDKLIEENVELKSQLEEANKKLYLCAPEIPQNVHGEYVNYVDLVNEIYELKEQQQEFIKYLKHCIENEKQLEKSQKTQIFIDTQDMEERYAEGKYQDYLEEHVKELKKQLEEEKMSHEFDERIVEQHCDFVDEHYRQQKEFIKYLEDMLDDDNDIFSVIRVKDVLQKYKEIIGSDINVGSKGGDKDDK